MKALLIDHDDSFTYNLRDWLSPAFSVEVRNHRDLEVGSLETASKNLIVLSPGPKSPKDYPLTRKFLEQLNPAQNVLGVCLGLQIMNECEGGKVSPYLPPLHGKKSKLSSSEDSLSSFDGLNVARYHSLYCQTLSPHFQLLAISAEDKKPMWLRHRSKKWLGFQFHPESFLTEKPEWYLSYVKEWCAT